MLYQYIKTKYSRSHFDDSCMYSNRSSVALPNLLVIDTSLWMLQLAVLQAASLLSRGVFRPKWLKLGSKTGSRGCPQDATQDTKCRVAALPRVEHSLFILLKVLRRFNACAPIAWRGGLITAYPYQRRQSWPDPQSKSLASTIWS